MLQPARLTESNMALLRQEKSMATWRNQGSLTLRSSHRCATLSALIALGVCPLAFGQNDQQGLSEPVYRVASETPAQAPATAPNPVIANAAAATAFDLTQQPGEHPLA